MINYKKIQVTDEIAETIACDICKKTYSFEKDWEEAQEFIRIDARAGFGSIFGDSNRVSIDICQHCFKEKLGEFIRIE